LESDPVYSRLFRREQLYRSFSENGNPTLKTTLAVMKALGIELTAKVPTPA
jgi:probable addiction module antidote protein